MTTTDTRSRTDVHRPSAAEFDPQAYVCVGVFDLMPEWGDDGRGDAVRGMVARGFRFASHQQTGQCGHCGAALRYCALMVREDVREMIYVGETCLDGRFESQTAESFQRLRKSARLNRERATRDERIAEWVREVPEFAVLLDSDASWAMGDFVGDVAARFRSSGRLSDGQRVALLRAIVRAGERAAERAAREAAAAVAAAEDGAVVATDCPTGTLVVTGEVLSVQWRDSDYGGAWKMTVRDDRGFRVYTAVPSSLRVLAQRDGSRGDRLVEVGERVTFTVNVDGRPADDATLGWGKRPRKATLLG